MPVGHQKPFGIGIIGVGMVADTHARALAELNDCIEICGVFARDQAALGRFAVRHGLQAATSLSALLDQPGLDAILLLTPPNARLDIIRAAAVRGKHVLSEKPLGRDSGEARDIVRLCEEVGIALGVVLQHRFRAASIALRLLVESCELGRVAIVQVSVPWWRPQSYYDEPGRGTYARDGGGVLISQAIHTLDLMLSVAGPVSEVSAVAGTSILHSMEAEDFVGAGLRFANGALGMLTTTTAAFPGGAESIVITFERGQARLEGGCLTLIGMDGSRREIGETAATGGGADPMAFPHDWHRDLIADFAMAVNQGRQPIVTGRDALRVHELIDALILSSREKRTVFLDKMPTQDI